MEKKQEDTDESTRNKWVAPELKKGAICEDTLNGGGPGSDGETPAPS